MKSIKPLFLIAGLLLLAPFAKAQTLVSNQDLTINSLLKKTDEKSAALPGNDTHITQKIEKWEYQISVANKSFKPIPATEVKYIIFFKRQMIGMKTAPRLARLSGSATLQEIPGNQTAQFTTKLVELKKEFINGNYYFANGAKSNAEDSIIGIWVRLYQNGKLFSEFVRPPSLTAKEKWE